LRFTGSNCRQASAGAADHPAGSYISRVIIIHPGVSQEILNLAPLNLRIEVRNLNKAFFNQIRLQNSP
jgi:hypothetical protein